MDKMKEKERTKKQTDKEIIHNSIHYAQKIEELQFDLNEKEQRLKEAAIKIMDLKNGNSAL